MIVANKEFNNPRSIRVYGVTPYEVGGDLQSYSIDFSFRGAETDLKVYLQACTS
jgi:hypothetical protein